MLGLVVDFFELVDAPGVAALDLQLAAVGMHEVRADDPARRPAQPDRWGEGRHGLSFRHREQEACHHVGPIVGSRGPDDLEGRERFESGFHKALHPAQALLPYVVPHVDGHVAFGGAPVLRQRGLQEILDYCLRRSGREASPAVLPDAPSRARHEGDE